MQALIRKIIDSEINENYGNYGGGVQLKDSEVIMENLRLKNKPELNS